jgi:nitroreductase
MSKYLEPWNRSADDFPAGSFASDQLEFLLGYAILAPSTHNTQPWLFRINAMDVELFADRRRTLNVVDPEGRELILSCGAALLNLQIAAEYFGHTYRVEVLPEPAQPDLLARFHLGLEGETRGEDIVLFHAITQRHTSRQAFEDRAVPEELLRAFEVAANEYGAWLQIIREEPLRQAVADLVAEGDRQQWANKAFRAEVALWARAKPEAHGDGLPMTLAGVKDWLTFAGPSLIRTFDRGGGQAASDRDIALRSPVLAVLGTSTEDIPGWLSGGQALQRVLLGAQAEEVRASILNQPIEIPELRAKLVETLKCPGYPQVLLRIGYGPEAPPTPRRSVRDVLIMHQTVRTVS